MTKSLKYAIALFASLAMGAAASAADKPLATVNGKAITQQLLDTYSLHRPQGQGKQEDVINELVAQELLVQEAKRQGLEKNAQIKMEIEVLKRNVLAGNAIRTYLEKHPVSDAETKAEYDKLKGNLVGEEYKARHILLKSEAEAKAVIAELKKGADFTALAKKRSTGPSAAKGGDLGWFNPNQMVPPFAEALKKLKKGAFSAAPVQTQFGWHVILLEDTRTKPAPTYEQVKPRLQVFLQQKKTQEYIQSLREKAKIVK